MEKRFDYLAFFIYFAPCHILLRFATSAGSVTKFALRFIRDPTGQFLTDHRKKGSIFLGFFMFFGPCQNLLRFATSADVTKFA
jgi:hypothetical protein